MKSFRVFFSVLIIVFSLFANFFTTQKTYALTTETYTHQKAQANVLPLFQTFIDAVTSGKTNASTLTSDEGKKRYAAYLAVSDKLIASINKSKNAYTSNYNSSLSPVDAQIAAVPKAQQSILADKPSLINDMRKAGLEPVYNVFYSKLDDAIKEAQAIKESGDSGNLTVDPTAITNAQKNIDTIVANQDKGKCTLWSWTITGCINEAVTWLIKNTFLQIAGFLVWLTANMFNYSVQIGILQFSQWAPDTLYPIWIVVRQVISLVIVFVGLYLGFMYIIGREDKFEKYIPWVIIFALFVNFSYPLVRTAIDISNIISLKIYVSAVGNEALTGAVTSKNTAGALIMDKLGLGGLIASATSVEQAEKSGAGMLGNINSVPGALLAVAFALYAAYIFFMATLIVIARTAALIFIIISSPLLLVDSVIPVLGQKAQDLRKIFFEQLAIAPVFMIMLALTLRFLEVFSVSAKNSLTTLSGGGVGAIATFFNILMMLIMLHIMIKVTKHVGGTVGEYVTNTVGQVGGFGLGVATSGAGFIARGSIGRLAAKARDSNWVERNQDKVGGRLAYSLSNSLAKSSFDLRNSKVVAKGAGMAGLSGGLLGVGMGAGSKSNFDEMEKAKTERIKARESRIKTRFERDVLKKDAKGNVEVDERGLPIILHKKGDTDPEGLAAKERYATNRGGALFLTKKQREELDTKATEELTALSVEGYKKLKSKEEKGKYIEQLSAKLLEIGKTDKNFESAEAQTLIRTLNTLKKEQDDFDKEVQNHKKKLDEITDENEKRKYLHRLSEDMYTAITGEKKDAPKDDQQATKEIAPGGTPQAEAFTVDTTKFNTNELDNAGLVPKTTSGASNRGGEGEENQSEGTAPIPPKNNPGSTQAAQVSVEEPFSVSKESLVNNNFAAIRKAKQAANLAKHGLGQPVPEPKPSGAVVVRPTSSQNNQMSGDQAGRVAAAIGGASVQKDRNSIPNDEEVTV
jgi:hypothetical protein